MVCCTRASKLKLSWKEAFEITGKFEKQDPSFTSCHAMWSWQSTQSCHDRSFMTHHKVLSHHKLLMQDESLAHHELLCTLLKAADLLSCLWMKFQAQNEPKVSAMFVALLNNLLCCQWTTWQMSTGPVALRSVRSRSDSWMWVTNPGFRWSALTWSG